MHKIRRSWGVGCAATWGDRSGLSAAQSLSRSELDAHEVDDWAIAPYRGPTRQRLWMAVLPGPLSTDDGLEGPDDFELWAARRAVARP